MKKAIASIMSLAVLLSVSSCTMQPAETTTTAANTETTTTAEAPKETTEPEEIKYQRYVRMTPGEIVAEMTLEQKAYQMVQPAIYMTSNEDMKLHDYGSILSTSGPTTASEWRDIISGFQQAAIDSKSGIPFIYGQDDVHGVNYCVNAVYFPHNIGQGAANDEELAYQVGLITADEAKICNMMWNFSPVVAQSADPRWGRTYESYGSDLDIITRLSTAYTKGLIDGGIVACTKHFFADGNVKYGTGEQGDIKMLIDRGDARLSDEEINELLKVYQAQIDAGVQTIMISHSSLNGVKMHENKEYIMKLKDEMGFKGFIVSDWGSIQNIPASSYKEQVIKSVNAGIDMLMETDRFEEAKQIIVDAVGSGDISEDRVNDAVTRIIKVKKDVGLFDDPMLKDLKTEKSETGSPEYRKVAEKLVEESLVLLKNDKKTLPIKEGSKVCIMGPAADNGQVQCGGWTVGWNNAPSIDVEGVTTITEAFERYAKDYGIEIVKDIKDCDIVLLYVGEQSYAEWNGDTEDLELCGMLGLSGNRKAIDDAARSGKPTVTCIVAGRQVILDKKDYGNWDSVVMCYLPGSEGKGISDVLCGCADFTGKLPSPWYGSVDEIGTDKCFLEKGYGLNYGDGFKARTEPDATDDKPSEEKPEEDIMAGTNYTKGLFKDGDYVNDYANIRVSIPADELQVSDEELNAGRKENLAEITDEKELRIESAKVWDACFDNSGNSMAFDFINLELAAPDDPDFNEDDYLDFDIKCLETNLNKYNINIENKGRTKVKLADNEYTRQYLILSQEGGPHQTVCFYARKIDDKLMSIIEICFFKDCDPSEYEKLFK